MPSFLREPPQSGNAIASATQSIHRSDGRRIMKKPLIAAAAALLLSLPAHAADTIRIGFVTTLSGPAGIIGKHMKDAADLSLGTLGGKAGGLPGATVYGDDQLKPE